MAVIPRSFLYVPATSPGLVDKALASAADAIVLDLEDSVLADQKEAARRNAGAVLRDRLAKPVYVRVNPLSTGLAYDDLRAVASPQLAGIRLPKCENPDDVRAATAYLMQAECETGVHVLIESALGVELAFALATSDPAVGALALGEADLRADLRITGDDPLDYARARCVSAARAAGLPSPVQSVYTAVRDLDGLRVSCLRGRAMGFWGRSALNPAQVDVINEVYTPTAEEVRLAQETVDSLGTAAQVGKGAAITPDGRFVDEAVVNAAHRTLELAAQLHKESFG